MGGDTGGGDDRKNLLKFRHVLLLFQILPEGLHPLFLVLHLNDLQKIPVLGAVQFLDIAGGSIVEIFLQFLQIIVQQRQRFLLRHLSQTLQPPLDLPLLPSRQIRLKGQHLQGCAVRLLVLCQSLQGLPTFPQLQTLLVSAQKLREFSGPVFSVIPIPVQGGFVNFYVPHALIEAFHGL